MNTSIKAFHRRLDAFAVHGSGLNAPINKLLDEVGKLIPYEAACFTTVDPLTLLSTGAVTDSRIEALHHELFINEYGQEDLNQYRQLAQAIRPVAALSQSTNGQPGKSPRYRDILFPAGFGDELRAAIVADGRCAGFITLLRKQSQPLFNVGDEEMMVSLLPAIARCLLNAQPGIHTYHDPQVRTEPGILLFTDKLVCLSSNEAGNDWLTRLREWEHIDHTILPRPIRAVITRAMSESRHSESAITSKIRISLPEGVTLVLRASLLRQTSGAAQIAVWLEPASAADMLPLLMEAYGLSEREKQIIGQVIRGVSTKELAQAFHISAYTVQDHMKSIFSKTGVTSRRELIWQLFSRFNEQREA